MVSRFERLVAIPEQEYKFLKNTRQIQQPSQGLFSSLSNDYSRQSFIQDPYERIQRQGETMNALLKLKDDMRRRIVQSTPKPYQSRAESLLKFIEGQIEVNDKGEILDSERLPLEGSNITDLVQHAVRDRRRNIQPLSWKVFKNRLQDMNVPQSLLNYETLEEMKRPLSIKSSPTSIPEVVKPLVTQTPKKRKASDEGYPLERRRKHKQPKRLIEEAYI